MEPIVKMNVLRTPDDLLRMQQLERDIWGTSLPLPLGQLIAAVNNGGVAIGAEVDGKMVGFLYSFAGFDGDGSGLGEPYLYSHMMGTHPDYRRQAIAEKLKWAQRDWALEHGYRRVRWTFDPLETINAYFNFTKLGAVFAEYKENYYGAMHDALNRGLTSDRLVLEWRLDDAAVAARAEGSKTANTCSPEPHVEPIHCLNTWQCDEHGFPAEMQADLTRSDEWGSLYIGVPAQYREIKQQQIELAFAWRQHFRELYQYYQAAGWQIRSFIRNPDKQQPIHYYELCKNNELLKK